MIFLSFSINSLPVFSKTESSTPSALVIKYVFNPHYEFTDENLKIRRLKGIEWETK